MYVEGAQRLAPPLTADFVSSPPRPTLAAMLDQADADDASLLTRLCAVTAFTRATDEAFAEPPSADVEPLRELVARHSAALSRRTDSAATAQRLCPVRAGGRQPRIDSVIRAADTAPATSCTRRMRAP